MLPSLPSRTSGQPASRRSFRPGPASSRLQVSQADHPHAGVQDLELADDSMDSHDEEYKDNASQSRESEEADLIELDEDDEDETADRGAQRPITTWHQSTGSQQSILTVRATPTESLDRRIGYPRRKTPGVGPITQNPPTSGRPAVLRKVSNVPVTPIPTPTHSG